MHEKTTLYSSYAPNFIPTCLVPLFDCPNLVTTFDPDCRTLIPGFNVSRLKDLVVQLSQRSASDELFCQAIDFIKTVIHYNLLIKQILESKA